MRAPRSDLGTAGRELYIPLWTAVTSQILALLMSLPLESSRCCVAPEGAARRRGTALPGPAAGVWLLRWGLASASGLGTHLTDAAATLCTRVSAHVCSCVCVWVLTCFRTGVFVHVLVCVSMYVSVCAHMFLYMCPCGSAQVCPCMFHCVSCFSVFTDVLHMCSRVCFSTGVFACVSMCGFLCFCMCSYVFWCVVGRVLLYACVFATCVFVCLCAHACVSVCVFMYAFQHTLVYFYHSLCVYLYMSVHMSLCVSTHTHTCTHTCQSQSQTQKRHFSVAPMLDPTLVTPVGGRSLALQHSGMRGASGWPEPPREGSTLA